jgi:hypothetical protein
MHVKRKLLRRYVLAKCWILGFREFRSGCGLTWNNPWTDRSMAYDAGRDFAHKITFRRYDH